MERYDIARIRKNHGMSQRQLAQELQMKQSFLSAIENGRSPLPMDKEARIMEIFGLHSLEPYIIHEHDEQLPSLELSESDLFTRLLKRFHEHEHKHSPDARQMERVVALEDRNDRLSARVDELTTRLDTARDENEALKAEIFRLKELLIRAGIEY